MPAGARGEAGGDEGRDRAAPAAGGRAEADRRAARRGAVAEVPGLPRVALDESEPARADREPAVRRRRTEVELGAEPVKRRPGPRHPARIRTGREEPGLLGVRAKAADDDEPVPIGAGGGGEPVEGERDVRAHRLALADRERVRGTRRPRSGRGPRRPSRSHAPVPRSPRRRAAGSDRRRRPSRGPAAAPGRAGRRPAARRCGALSPGPPRGRVRGRRTARGGCGTPAAPAPARAGRAAPGPSRAPRGRPPAGGRRGR